MRSDAEPRGSLSGTRSRPAGADSEADDIRALADTLPGAILSQMVVSPDGTVRLTYVSAGVAEVVGLSAAEVMTSPAMLCALIVPEDLARLRAATEAALRTVSPFDVEIQLRTTRGDLRALSIRGVPQRRLDGAVILSGIAIDNTDRRRAEDALRERETQLRGLGDNLPDGIIYQVVRRRDGSNYFPYMSSGLERVFGVRPDEIQSDPDAVYRLIHPEDLARLRAAADESIRTGHPFNVECRLRTPDHGYRWLQLRGRPRACDDGATLWDAIALDVTERRRVEEVLRYESEERFRAVFEQAAVGIAVMAPDGRFFRVNRRLCEMLGYTRAELEARRFPDVTHPDDLAISLARRDLLLAGKAPPYSLEKRYLHKNGRVVWIELTLSPLQELTGTSSGHAIAIVQDVSARKAAEQALRDSEASFRFMFADNPLPMWVFDLETLAFLEVNEATVKAYGYGRDEFLAMRVTDIGPPEEEARLRRWLKVAHPPDHHDDGEWQHRLRSGRLITVHVTSHPMVFKGRRARLVVGEDISERKAAERALRESEERFRATFEQAAVGMAIVAPDGRFLRVNGRLCAMTAYTREELLARRYQDITHADDLALNTALRQPMLDGTMPSFSMEKRYLRKDGSTLWVDLTASIAHGDPGASDYSIAIIHDITLRKQLENEFRHAQRLEGIGQLAGGIAHDFNNLLTVIAGHCHLALDRMKAGDPLHRQLDLIRRTSERAAALTHQLLAFSRKQLLQPKIVAINELIADSTTLLRRLIGEDIDLVFVPTADVGRVHVDPSQLEQVIVNLAVNARDAMPGGGRLTIETSNVELDATYAAQHVDVTPGRYVMLAVTDTGTGMTPEVQARIFEPFFTTKTPGKGTGLGLATVYGIVKQSGGHVRVYSEPGVGTTFTIYLPRTDATAERRTPTAVVSMPTGTETVLLVEDEAEVRKLAKEVLERLGYAVLEAPTPGEVSLIVQRYNGIIHLLLTDVVMPQMGGRAVAQLVTAEHPETKVLFMSGYSDDAIARHGVLEPGTEFLEKPFTPWTLAAKVRAALDRRDPP